MKRHATTLARCCVGTIAAVVAVGCAYERTEYADAGEVEYLNEQPIPPAAPVEYYTVSPGPGYVWIGGEYAWVGPRPYHYVWVPGRWERPSYAHAQWAPGNWRRDHRGWRYEHGHWR
jgi:hypothetical protein